MNAPPTEIYGAIQIFQALYGLGRRAIIKAKTRLATPLRPTRLSDDVFFRRIDFGTTVTVHGKLSRFGFTYRPMTYAPMTTVAGRTRVKNTVLDYPTGTLRNIMETSAVNRVFQFPIQTTPPITTDEGNYCIAFLYPQEFRSFLLPQDKRKQSDQTSADCLAISAAHQGIPVLLRAKILEKISETEVTVTGTVAEIPREASERILATLCATRRQFFYAFYRPTAHTVSYCIDCRDEKQADFRIAEKLSNVPAAFFIEGHFEGVTDARYEQHFIESIPKLPAGLKLQIQYGHSARGTVWLTEDAHELR